jgi:hypothetical protein
LKVIWQQELREEEEEEEEEVVRIVLSALCFTLVSVAAQPAIASSSHQPLVAGQMYSLNDGRGVKDIVTFCLSVANDIDI